MSWAGSGERLFPPHSQGNWLQNKGFKGITYTAWRHLWEKELSYSLAGYLLELRNCSISYYHRDWVEEHSEEDSVGPKVKVKVKVKVKLLSRVRLFANPWTVAYQAPPSMGFSRQEYWSGLPLPSQRIILTQGLNPGIEPRDQTQVSHIGSRRFNLWATRAACVT